MIKLVDNYIKQNNLIDNTSVVLALSGGIDSMVLLDILLKLNYRVIVAHVNHKKREESAYEEEQIKKLCDELKITYEIYHLDKHQEGNFHDYAHNKRYSFFIDVCNKHNVYNLVTAHHLNDNLETILLNLMRGSNLYGYSGISNKIQLDNINISRPLLCVGKDLILNYAKNNNIVYYEDSSNNEEVYLRNKVRKNIIPQLQNYSSSILDKSIQYSNILQESFDFIRSNTINYLNTYFNIEVSSFNKLHIALQKDIICYLLEKYNIEKNSRVIEKMLFIINSDKPQLDYNLENNFIFKKRYNNCYIEKKIDFIKPYIVLNDISSIYKDDCYNIYFSKTLEEKHSVKSLKVCYNKLAFPLVFRTKENEDVILMSFGRKKIKDLFIDKKIPREKRENTLILSDQSNNILWVVGLAINHELQLQKEDFDGYLIVENLKGRETN